MKYWITITTLLFNLYSQAQSVENGTLTNDSIDFIDAVKLLEESYQVKFAFDHELLSTKKVSKWNPDISLDEVLTNIIHPLGFEFEHSDQTVLIIPKVIEIINNFGLSGVIIDKVTGEALPNATVYLTQTGQFTITNREGKFSFINIPSDTSRIEVRYLGYTPFQFISQEYDSLDHVKINLSNEAAVLDEIMVSGMKDHIFEISPQASKTSVDIEEFKTMANYGEPDVFRSVQLLPGISATNETSSGLNIRGGEPEQNLILFDGFTVYHLDHFFGIFSAFNSNVIKDVQLYKGGYGAEYGTRVSGVMDITGKSGNNYKPAVNIGLNMISSNAVIELPISKKLSFLVAGRRSYTDVIQSSLYNKLFNHVRENEPGSVSSIEEGEGLDDLEPNFYFYDINSKLSYRIDDDNIITFSYYDGKDNLSLQDSYQFFERTDFGDDLFTEVEESFSLSEHSNWGNRGGTLRYAKQWNKKLFTEIKIAGSKFFRNQDLNQELFYRFTGSYDTLVLRTDTLDFEIVRDTLEFVEDFGYAFQSINRVNENSVTISADYKIDDRNTLRFGAFNIRNKIRYQNIEDGAETDEINIDDDGSMTGLFSQYTLNFNSNRSAITGGVRFTRYSQTGSIYTEPRISINHQVSDFVTLKAAVGRYYQFAVNTTILDPASAQTSFWTLGGEEFIPVLESNHFVTGLTYRNGGFLIDAEAYYKKTKGLSRIALNALFEDFEPEDVFFTGEGTGYGLELLFKKDMRNYSAWLSYTLSKTQNQFDQINFGRKFNANEDQRHEINFVQQLKLGKFDLTAAWIYGSGRPFSPPDSVELPVEGGFSFFIPSLNLSNRNTEVLPAYHRLDLSVAYNAMIRNAKLTFGVNLLNLYGRRNIKGYRYGPGFDETEQVDFIDRKAIRLLPFTPSVFLNFSF